LDLSALKFFPGFVLSPPLLFQSSAQAPICALKFGDCVLSADLYQLEQPPGTMPFQVWGHGPEIPIVQNL